MSDKWADAYNILPDGRIYVDYGPVSMVITARGADGPITDIGTACMEIIDRNLSQMSDCLAELKKPAWSADTTNLPRIACKMIEAARRTGEATLTPMAAVAGAMSDSIADYLENLGIPVIIVNNGGDIALRLSEGESIKLGLISDLSDANNAGIISISSDMGIEGVATSGQGGRSFSRGIASAVTVFSKSCILADVCATHIANCSYIDSPRVKTALAGDIDPDSDIAELSVVTEVLPLSAIEIEASFSNMDREIKRQAKMDNLIATAAYIQNKSLVFGLK